MSMLTNKLGLPRSLERATANDDYHKGACDFSITELIGPARIRALRKIHEHEIVEDVADKLWALYGKMAHKILEQANEKDLVEKRYFAKIIDKTISGQIDHLDLDTGVLSDFKMTTVWSFMAHKPPKPEWLSQLNIQKWLIEKNGGTVTGLQIIGLLRDWGPAMAEKDRNYPNTQIAKMVIPIWPKAQTEEYITERIRAHLSADADLPFCTQDEHWRGRRCTRYCSVVKFCSQYQNSNGRM